MKGVVSMKACCVTGHRDIPMDKIEYVTSELRKAIQEAIDDGFTLFISGFAPGGDIIFARLVIELKVQYPQINLEAALPYPNWLRNRSTEDKELFSKCVGFGIHSPKYTPNCFLVRNRFMANTCERIIAVYDGRAKGGTVNTMMYAAALERDIRTIEI
jgi:uncharacterized phage-like protein YoqJ